MNTIIRNVKGCEVTFHHDSYFVVNGWLERHNIQYERFNVVIDPATYQPIPCAIRFQNEKDLMWFLLRWS